MTYGALKDLSAQYQFEMCFNGQVSQLNSTTALKTLVNEDLIKIKKWSG